jgi:hypothetical protein
LPYGDLLVVLIFFHHKVQSSIYQHLDSFSLLFIFPT